MHAKIKFLLRNHPKSSRPRKNLRASRMQAHILSDQQSKKGKTMGTHANAQLMQTTGAETIQQLPQPSFGSGVNFK